MNIEILKPTFSGNYTRIQNAIISDSSIGMVEKAFLQYLFSKHPNFVHSVKRWAKENGCSERRIRRIISNLVKAGYAHTTEQEHDKDGYFTEKEYFFYSSPSENPYFSQRMEKTAPYTVDKNRLTVIDSDTLYNTSSTCLFMFVYDTDGTKRIENFEIPVNEDDAIKPETAKPETKSIEPVDELTADEFQALMNETIAESPDLTAKIKLIPDMTAYIKNLFEIVLDRLKTIIHPKSRQKFVKKIIKNQIQQYQAPKHEPKAEPKPKKKTAKTAYGKYNNVLLSDAEYTALINEHGETFVNGIIEQVSEWCNERDKTGYNSLVKTFITNAKKLKKGELSPEQLERINRYKSLANHFGNDELSEQDKEYLSLMDVFGKPSPQQEYEEMQEYLSTRYENDSESTTIPEIPNENGTTETTENQTAEPPKPEYKPIPTDENGKPMIITNEIMELYSLEDGTFFNALNQESQCLNPFFYVIHYGKLDNIHNAILADARKYMNDDTFQAFVQQLNEKATTESPEFLDYIGFEMQ